jgi:hypothetical protein
MEHTLAYRAYLSALSLHQLQNERERVCSERREIAVLMELSHRLAKRDALAVIAAWQHAAAE